MTKTEFSKYTLEENGCRTTREALDELKREIDVRIRLYDRWVAEGRMSFSDGHDRLERILTAYQMLSAAAGASEGGAAE